MPADIDHRFQPPGLYPKYVVPEVVVALAAFVGNLLVIVAFLRDKKLRKLTNYYVVSLAVADLLVALFGIPFAILASAGLPRHFGACLFTTSSLIMLCTISILNLVAVSIDRYWAILYPLQYSSFMTTSTAVAIIVGCWIVGAVIGLLPLMGWHEGKPADDDQCIFVKIMDYDFLVFLYFATIIAPSLVMGIFYLRIYSVVIRQLRQISALSSQSSFQARVNVLINKKEVHAAKTLFIIILFFVLCWIPLYTINCVTAFCRECYVPQWLMDTTIVLSHVNSAVNPFLYAYHLKDFREAFKNLLLMRPVVHQHGAGRRPMTPAYLTQRTTACTTTRVLRQDSGLRQLSAASLRRPMPQICRPLKTTLTCSEATNGMQTDVNVGITDTRQASLTTAI